MTENIENGGPRWSVAAGCGITLGIFLIWIIVFYSFEFLYLLFFHESEIFSLPLAISVTILSLLFTLGTLQILRLNPLKISGLQFSIMSVLGFFVGTIVGALGIAATLLSFTLMSRLSYSDLLYHCEEEIIGGQNVWIISSMIALFACVEEIIFRGLLYPLLKRSVGIVSAMFLSALAFSAMHIFNPDFQIIAAFNIFLAGVFLCLMMEIGGNLYVACGAHFGWNMAQVVAGLPMSGYRIAYENQMWGLEIHGPDYLTGGNFGIEASLVCSIVLVAMIVILTLILIHRKFDEETTQKGNPVFQ